MTLKKYEVVIEETRTYRIEVEAETEAEAEELAFNHDDFLQDNIDDTDAVAVEVNELED